jgi:thymidylate kinase
MSSNTERQRFCGLIVELAGAPGSGKTSIAGAVEAGCRKAGLRPMWSGAKGRELALRTPFGRVAGRLIPPRLGGLLLRVQRFRSAISYLVLHPALAWMIARTQLRRPAGAMSRERGVVRWFAANVGVIRLFCRWGSAGEALLVEEGYAHRVVQLFTSPVEEADPGLVDRYFDLIPRPDLLVHVRADVASCVERVKARGVWERMERLSAGELEAFIHNAHAASELACEAARARGWNVIEVENTGDLGECLRAVTDAVAMRLE